MATLLPMTAAAIRRLRAQWQPGQVLAYPTEAVFGLGCPAFDLQAIQKILELKQRRWQQGMIVIAADWSMLTPYLSPLAMALQQQVAQRPDITWLLPVKPQVSPYLRGQHDRLAVRLSVHPVARAVSLAFEAPVVSTSANPHGKAPARSRLQVRRYFPGLPIIPGALGGAVRPSAIFDPFSQIFIRS
jgi:L-threonylcarbamoyladenylate synthase